MKNLLFIFLCSLFITTSCSSVKKLQTSAKSSTDSSAVQSKISSEVRKSDSSVTKNVSGDYEKETTYQYDSIPQYISIAGKIDTVIRYVPRIITVVEKGSYNYQQAAKQVVTDSSNAKTFKVITVNAKTATDIRTKEKSGMPGWIICYLVIAAAFFGAYVFFAIRRDFKI